MRARLLASLLLLAAASPALAESPSAGQASGFKVIVHPANTTRTLTRRELHDVFLKKTTQWPDGSRIEPVEPPERSKTRAYFLSDVMEGKSAFALKTFWQRRVFSGRDTPPLEKGTEEEVVAFVRATPGAVGYVATGVATEGVKVLKLTD